MLVDLKVFNSSKSKMYLHAYIYLLKVYIFFFKKELLYYYIIYKILSENNNWNERLYNDFGLRALLNENVMNALNYKPPNSEENKIEVKYNCYVKIRDVLKNDVDNLKKFKNFESDDYNLPKDLNSIYSKLVSENFIENFPLVDFIFFILFQNFMDDFFKREKII